MSVYKYTVLDLLTIPEAARKSLGLHMKDATFPVTINGVDTTCELVDIDGRGVCRCTVNPELGAAILLGLVGQRCQMLEFASREDGSVVVKLALNDHTLSYSGKVNGPNLLAAVMKAFTKALGDK